MPDPTGVYVIPAGLDLAALPVTNRGTGTWSVITGTGIVADLHDAGSAVSNLAFGNNQFQWNVVSEFGICAGSNDRVINNP